MIHSLQQLHIFNIDYLFFFIDSFNILRINSRLLKFIKIYTLNMQQINFRIEKFIAVLLMLGPYLKNGEQFDAIYLAILIILFSIKLKKQGATIKTIFLILALFCNSCEMASGIKYFYIATSLLSALCIFLPFKVYILPQIPNGVAYKKITLPDKYKKLTAIIIYPVEQVKKIKIPWMDNKTLLRMRENDRNPVPIPFFLFEFIFSYLKIYVRTFSLGKFKKTRQAIIFSHGKGASLHSYTSLLGNLGVDKLIITVQHSEKIKLSEVQQKTQKQFRQNQLDRRSDQLNIAFDFINDKNEMKNLLGEEYESPQKCFYMGHSHGGSTITQAYFKLQQSKKKNIRGLILLDPWLFPLRNERINQLTNIPTIIIANQLFLKGKFSDKYQLVQKNKKFIQKNSKTGIQIILKDADHLHQCDLCFILGSTMKLVQNYELSQHFFNINLLMIRQFIQMAQIKQIQQIKNKLKANCKSFLVQN